MRRLITDDNTFLAVIANKRNMIQYRPLSKKRIRNPGRSIIVFAIIKRSRTTDNIIRRRRTTRCIPRGIGNVYKSVCAVVYRSKSLNRSIPSSPEFLFFEYLITLETDEVCVFNWRRIIKNERLHHCISTELFSYNPSRPSARDLNGLNIVIVNLPVDVFECWISIKIILMSIYLLAMINHSPSYKWSFNLPSSDIFFSTVFFRSFIRPRGK